MRQKLLVVKVLVPVVLLLVLTADAQDFQIRTRVDLVVVPVTVKGKSDQLVTGLQKEDFTVLEDGRRQTITNFTIDPVPLSAAVVVDTGLGADSLSKVQQTFPALAGAFSQFDEVALYRFDKFVTKMMDFSNDLTAVETTMKTLGEIQPDTDSSSAGSQSPFSTPGPVINGAPVVPAPQVGVIAPQPAKRSKVLHDAIFTAASDLAKRQQNRRKIVLVVSDGIARGSSHSFDETDSKLLDLGIQVYAIALAPKLIGEISSPLTSYAKTTGGDAYFVNSVRGLEDNYARATEQARNQYVLGYVSNNEVYGDQPVFRNIQVRLDRDGFETLHRKGYYQYP